MKSIIFFVAVVALAQGQQIILPRHGLPPAGPPEARAALPTWGTINQRQDNFNVSNQNTWNMRYLESSQFFKTGGPIFLMLGAEWTIDEGWLQSGQMYQMAQIHGAQMYYTEHRYYGKSYPTKKLSSDNLKYLTTAQALEDVAQFINKTKQNNPDLANSKVVVFGGSYGGTMAIWMREKYPKLVHAAVSSSAPVLAKVDFSEYHNNVKRSLGTKCASVISNGAREVQKLLSAGNVEKIQKDFNLCWPIDNKNERDVQYFFTTIASKIGNLVQYAAPSTIPNLCNALQNPSSLTDYERLAAFTKHPVYCNANYEYVMKTLTNPALHMGNSRQWIYQTCTEYGFFMTSWQSAGLYGRTIPSSYYNKLCLDVFGPEFTAAVTANGVAATNAKYGALKPKVTRVVSVHGTVDPWRALGLDRDVNSQTPVIVVPGTSHCADLSSLSSNDSTDLNNAKMTVRKHIAAWLLQP